ncbi:MAG: sigma-70 family RNA polymerase sigma factor [Chloroflexi bacterium]|nr:sigma-70 family RNA polymerase sigma factor [Chloroflexota bacterium]MCH8225725.1 sigma-70 family RNA polymerase sigma factor [Chloroflexota bacterium]
MVTASQEFHCTTHSPLPVQDRSGQSQCYNCIIESFQSQAYNLARRMLSDWALAEDAVQESMVSGYRAFHQFRGDNLKAWLMRIVANTCRDMLRSRKARPTVPLDPLPPDDLEVSSVPSAVNLPSREESPEDYAERRELNRTIQGGLDSLPQDQRMSLLLVDVQGMSYEEAALVMGCSLGTVKSRISRGRRGLRDILRGAGELLPSRFRQDE